MLVGALSYHGGEPLTYAAEAELNRGDVVTISLRNKSFCGVIYQQVDQPKFKTKPIDNFVGLTLPTQLLELYDWLAQYYPAPLGQLANMIAPSYLASKPKKPVDPTTVNKHPVAGPTLTTEQTAAIKSITGSSASSFLLHGETGTGKTQVYIELAKQALNENKNVLVLTPEIGLTPQLAEAMNTQLTCEVIVLHSALTPLKRAKLWHKINGAATPLLVVGPRSALFSPLANIGLIVIDEFHDQAYKQGQPPHYLASRVAAKLAKLHSAKLVLGSATPPINDYYWFESAKLPIIRMTKLAKTSEFTRPATYTVDLKDRQLFNKSTLLSDVMIDSISEALSKQEQSLVFLNRRGTARLALCQNCGWQALCPNCDTPLTYHGDKYSLRCHSCSYQAKPPTNCPTCSSTDISFRGAGTKAIQEELIRLFPKTRIQRFDSDNKKADSFQELYQKVKAGEVDILVGTQLLTKGLDLPLLSVVGIVLADSSLYFPDYAAEERTFQVINQVGGRVGRGHRDAKLILQTYHPESPTINFALAKDYLGFYAQQIQERQTYNFPPFRHLLKLSCSRATSQGAQKAAVVLLRQLPASSNNLSVQGPAPAFIEKKAGKYYWQIIVKATRRPNLIKIINSLPPAGWTYDIDPQDLI